MHSGDVLFAFFPFQIAALERILDSLKTAAEKKERPIANLFLPSGSGRKLIVSEMLSEIHRTVSGEIYVIGEESHFVDRFQKSSGSFIKLRKYDIGNPVVLSIDQILDRNIEFKDGDFVVSFLDNAVQRLKLSKLICKKKIGILSVGNGPKWDVDDSFAPIVIPMSDNDSIFDYRDLAIAPPAIQAVLKKELVDAMEKDSYDWSVIEEYVESRKEYSVNHDKQELTKEIMKARSTIKELGKRYGNKN